MDTIICVDFDGVINSYKTPFDPKNYLNLPDPPVDGAIHWLMKLMKRAKVVIHTCRMLHGPKAEAAMRNWFFQNGMPNDVIDQLDFTCVKRGAHLYIDDKAYRFEGFFPNIDELLEIKPWWCTK